MVSQIQRNLPLVGAILVFWLFTAAMVALNVMRSGAFAYNLDDPYIHLAIARNWADYGVWGVTRYEWGSTTSSILWTALLAVLIKLGLPAREWLPFWLNMGFGTAILVVLHQWWRPAFSGTTGTITLGIGEKTRQIQRTTALKWTEFWLFLLFIFVVPIPAQVQNGMEHLLQILLTLLVTLFTGRVIAKTETAWGWDERWLLIIAPLMAMARYENLFVIAAVGLVLLWRRKWLLAGAVVVVSVLPLAWYGWLSVQHGWFPLPNSIVMKSGSTLNGVQDVLLLLFGRNVIVRLLFLEGHAIIPMVILFVGAMVAKLYLSWQQPRSQADIVTETAFILFLWTALFHSMFNSSAAAISSARYTGYFFAIAIGAFGYLALRWVAQARPTAPLSVRWQNIPNGIAVIGVVGLISFPFIVRSVRELRNQWFGSSNIYEQQVQMGRFLNTYYTGASVAANDIGAINYFADIRCLDLIGLGSLDVAQESRDGSFVTADIDRVAKAHDVTIAILYDKWFPPGSHVAPPDHWITVAHWTIPDNVVAASPTITFYATSPAEAEKMRTNLADFAEQLPGRVLYLPTEEQTP